MLEDFDLEVLKWLAPMVVGGLLLLGSFVGLCIERLRGWSMFGTMVLAVALIGAGVFSKVSLTRQGVIIETAQNNLKALGQLRDAVSANTESIKKISDQIDDIVQITMTSQDSANAVQFRADWMTIFESLESENKKATESLNEVLKINKDALATINEIQG